MKITLWITLCSGTVFSVGYLVGSITTRDLVETSAQVHVERFSDEVRVLQGRVMTMERICR